MLGPIKQVNGIVVNLERGKIIPSEMDTLCDILDFMQSQVNRIKGRLIERTLKTVLEGQQTVLEGQQYDGQIADIEKSRSTMSMSTETFKKRRDARGIIGQIANISLEILGDLDRENKFLIKGSGIIAEPPEEEKLKACDKLLDLRKRSSIVIGDIVDMLRRKKKGSETEDEEQRLEMAKMGANSNRTRIASQHHNYNGVISEISRLEVLIKTDQRRLAALKEQQED
jgi:hypothetical protein